MDISVAQVEYGTKNLGKKLLVCIRIVLISIFVLIFILGKV